MVKNLSTYSDKELVKMIRGDKAQSEAAFTEIYDRYGLRVNAYIRSILNNKELAEDAFQETFLKFYLNVKEDYTNGTTIGYLIKIARNLCLNIKRDSKHNVSLEDFDFPVVDKIEFEDKELTDVVMMSLELLDTASKEIVIMRIFDDLPYNEIADILNITAARARYLFFNAKNRIKTVLTPYLSEENS